MPAPDLIAPTPAEMDRARARARTLHGSGVGRAIGEADGGLLSPFSFFYGRQCSDDFLALWPCVSKRSAAGEQSEHTWQDPHSGLQVRVVCRTYPDFPVVEWTVWLANTGDRDTAPITDFHGGDLLVPAPPDAPLAIHSVSGDYYSAHGYEPYVLALPPGCEEHIAPVGGRGSNRAFPYFNLRTPYGGLMIAVGWPGQWEATFIRSANGELRFAAGQQQVNLVLHPGERIRGPLMALLRWEGDDLDRAQNLWRRWMVAYNVPRVEGGELPPPLLFGGTSLQFNEMTQATEENQQDFISRYLQAGVPLDYWWMDAGWYPCDGHWPRTGTWEPDPVRFPHGLRAISDFAHERGLKTLLWFEPERVADGTWLQTEHPEWLLNQPGAAADQPQNRLLDLGHPEACQWLIDHVDRVLTEQGIDLYRQDHNFDPLAYWRAHDAPDRQGMTENLHVQGYLRFWDELRRRHPGMLIDSCASGGRRNDLETMRRAVPLHPTDFDYWNLPVKQSFHFSLNQWLPYYGSNTMPVDTVNEYAVRSGHGSGMGLGYDLRRDDLDLALLVRLVAEWRAVAPLFLADFYPLTPNTRDNVSWMAWQFHDPAGQTGMVQAFRRAESPYESARFRLRGLDPERHYLVAEGDSGMSAAGRDLAEEGLRLAIEDCPGSVIITYRPVA